MAGVERSLAAARAPGRRVVTRRPWAAPAGIALGVLLVGGPALAQVTPPGGTTPGGPILDRLREQSTRPLPQVPPAPPPRGPDQIWVPEQRVRVPGVQGDVRVPGHWEQRLSGDEVYVPPLTGQAPDGRIIQFPAGQRRVPPGRESP
jgi:hypothetical protein